MNYRDNVQKAQINELNAMQCHIEGLLKGIDEIDHTTTFFENCCTVHREVIQCQDVIHNMGYRVKYSRMNRVRVAMFRLITASSLTINATAITVKNRKKFVSLVQRRNNPKTLFMNCPSRPFSWS